jgi:homocysteine S-methyltransferase
VSLDPIRSILRDQRFLVLDGGLATELESRGCDLSDRLWSARLLVDDPAAIRQVHLAYLRAGADCVTSASYQATIPGFARRGLPYLKATELLRLSVQLATEARDEFWSEAPNRAGRLRPLVAASIGPYAACLANGSEYTGEYDVAESDLYDFHRDRWHLLGQSGADILACETIPSGAEVTALARLLSEPGDTSAWVSFSCGDAEHLRDGTRLQLAVGELTGLDRVSALGVNCVSPDLVPATIRQLRMLTDKPIIVYPNSGEGWDAIGKKWAGQAHRYDIGAAAVGWFDLGAALIGGCCRTGPDDIASIRTALTRAVSQ